MLIVVRHGRTATNAAGRLLGRADPSLDDLGRQQAAATADHLLETMRPARVVCSPLARTRETAEAFGLPVTVDERWIELDYGSLEGTKLVEVPKDYWQRWQSDIDFAPEGGESLSGLGERVRAACEDLADEAAEADVVVVSHVSPIKAAVAWALGVDDQVSWRMFVAPASITKISTSGPRRSLHGFNGSDHLGGLGGG
ncbi:MAG: histidine phosphatase family protein [Actinomycetota bacterium]|nr:histidine phosphatase family protein [Actinomycetota bacterium]